MEERTSTVPGGSMLPDLETRTENSGSAWTNSTASPVLQKEPS